MAKLSRQNDVGTMTNQGRPANHEDDEDVVRPPACCESSETQLRWKLFKLLRTSGGGTGRLVKVGGG